MRNSESESIPLLSLIYAALGKAWTCYVNTDDDLALSAPGKFRAPGLRSRPVVPREALRRLSRCGRSQGRPESRRAQARLRRSPDVCHLDQGPRPRAGRRDAAEKE